MLFGLGLQEAIDATPRANDIPLILEKCVDWVRQKEFNVPGFLEDEDMQGIQNVKELFDADADADLPQDISAAAVCGVMREYLSNLPEPILTFDAYSSFFDAYHLEDVDSRLLTLKMSVMMLLPPFQPVVHYLCNFLKEMSDSNANLYGIEELSKNFGPVFLWARPEVVESGLVDVSRDAAEVPGLVHMFIESCDEIFMFFTPPQTSDPPEVGAKKKVPPPISTPPPPPIKKAQPGQDGDEEAGTTDASSPRGPTLVRKDTGQRKHSFESHWGVAPSTADDQLAEENDLLMTELHINPFYDDTEAANADFPDDTLRTSTVELSRERQEWWDIQLAKQERNEQTSKLKTAARAFNPVISSRNQVEGARYLGWLEKKESTKYKLGKAQWVDRYGVIKDGCLFYYDGKVPDPSRKGVSIQLKGASLNQTASGNAIENVSEAAIRKSIMVPARRKSSTIPEAIVPIDNEEVSYRQHTIQREGWLERKQMLRWQPRYLIVRGGILSLYAKGPSADDGPPSELKVRMSLEEAKCEKSDVKGRSAIVVKSPREELVLSHEQAGIVTQWDNLLRAAINEAKDILGNMVMRTGWLKKKGHSASVGSGWKSRFFELKCGVLFYYEDVFKAQLKGSFPLHGCKLTGVDHGKKNVSLRFAVTDGANRSLWMEASDQEDLSEWTRAISEAIRQINSTRGTSTEASVSELKEIKTGWLMKKGLNILTWRKRYVVLTSQQLVYFTDETRQECRGVMDLAYCVYTRNKQWRGPWEHGGPEVARPNYPMVFTSGEKVMLFSAAHADVKEEDEWCQAIHRTIEEAHARNKIFNNSSIVVHFDLSSGNDSFAVEVSVGMTVGDVLRAAVEELVNRGNTAAAVGENDLAVFEVFKKQGHALFDRMLHRRELVTEVLERWESEFRFWVGKPGNPKDNVSVHLVVRQPNASRLCLTLRTAGRSVEFRAKSAVEYENWELALRTSIEEANNALPSKLRDII
eukprot:Rmarinus@m.8398